MHVFSVLFLPPVALALSIILNYFLMKIGGFHTEELFSFTYTYLKLYFRTVGSYTLFFIILLFILRSKSKDGEGYNRLSVLLLVAVICSIVGIIATVILQAAFNEINLNNINSHLLKFSIFFFYSPILILLDHGVDYIYNKFGWI